MIHLKSIINPKLFCVQLLLSTIVCHFLPSTDQCYHSTRTLYGLPNCPFSSTPGPHSIPRILSFPGIKTKFRPIAIYYAVPAQSPSGYPYASNSLTPCDLAFACLHKIFYTFPCPRYTIFSLLWDSKHILNTGLLSELSLLSLAWFPVMVPLLFLATQISI